MKIQPLTAEHRPKAYALLRSAFPRSEYEARLVQLLHEQDRPLHEWVCLHTGKAIAYLNFSRAFHGRNPCGLHLGPMAVNPEFQRQGIGSELLRFALRQEPIKSQPLFVLGAAGFFLKFGFTPCPASLSPGTPHNAQLLSLGFSGEGDFTLGYEAEFKTAKKAPQPQGSTRTSGAARTKTKNRR